MPIRDIEVTDEHRVQVEIVEFDRVLGGGIAKGSLMMMLLVFRLIFECPSRGNNLGQV
ncbi:MAG TPA: hypothetical protein VJL62_01300 [Thermodesulfobacteriota bacterium]|nr:hypothetical protein [Thermodesulfobacteriota bacterium]